MHLETMNDQGEVPSDTQDDVNRMISLARKEAPLSFKERFAERETLGYTTGQVAF